MFKLCPISARGVYLCTRYLYNLPSDDVKYCIGESGDKITYTYKNIQQYLKQNYMLLGHKAGFEDNTYYDGDIIWENFFLKKDFFKVRLEAENISTISQLLEHAKAVLSGRRIQWKDRDLMNKDNC